MAVPVQRTCQMSCRRYMWHYLIISCNNISNILLLHSFSPTFLPTIKCRCIFWKTSNIIYTFILWTCADMSKTYSRFSSSVDVHHLFHSTLNTNIFKKKCNQILIQYNCILSYQPSRDCWWSRIKRSIADAIMLWKSGLYREWTEENNENTEKAKQCGGRKLSNGNPNWKGGGGPEWSCCFRLAPGRISVWVLADQNCFCSHLSKVTGNKCYLKDSTCISCLST